MDDLIQLLLSIFDNIPSKRDPKQTVSQSMDPYQMTPWVAVLVFLFAGLIVGIFFLSSLWMAVISSICLFFFLQLLNKLNLLKGLHLTRLCAFLYSIGFLGGEVIIHAIAAVQIH